jgi:hypothetical protein
MTDQLQPQFTEILALIKNTQNYVIATSNQELIKLYWSIGKYIDDRLHANLLAFHPDAHPQRIERGTSRLLVKKRSPE